MSIFYKKIIDHFFIILTAAVKIIPLGVTAQNTDTIIQQKIDTYIIILLDSSWTPIIINPKKNKIKNPDIFKKPFIFFKNNILNKFFINQITQSLSMSNYE